MTKTMIRFVLVSNLLTPVLPIAATAMAASNTPCAIKKISASDLNSNWKVQVGERSISILGHQHVGALRDSEKQMSELVVLAAKAAKAKDCPASASALKTLLQSKSDLLDSALKLANDIQVATTDFHPQSLGVEFTPAMWTDRNSVSMTQLAMLDYLGKQCPENQSLLTTAAKIFPGPEYEYAKSHLDMTKAEPLEDPAIRARVDQSLAKFKTMSSASILELNQNAQRIAKEIMARIKSGEAVTEGEISSVAKAQGPGVVADAATNYLATYREILAYNPERNAKMAERVLADGGNYMIVIGNAHAGDLANRLYERCLKGEGRGTMTAGNTAAKGSQPSATAK